MRGGRVLRGIVPPRRRALAFDADVGRGGPHEPPGPLASRRHRGTFRDDARFVPALRLFFRPRLTFSSRPDGTPRALETVGENTPEKSSEDEDRSDRFSNDGAILNVTGSSTEDPAPEEGGDPPAGSPTGHSPEDADPPSVSFMKAASESGGAGRPRTTAGRSAATALLVAAGVWLCA